ELAGAEADLKDHRITLGRGHERGWGRVSIPADENPADDEWWFVFDEPAPRRAVVVAEDAEAARPLAIAAQVPPAAGIECSAEVISPEQLAAVDWDATALLLWQAPLPREDDAKAVRAFVDRGGFAVFFPPRDPSDDEFGGVQWTGWSESPDGPTV